MIAWESVPFGTVCCLASWGLTIPSLGAVAGPCHLGGHGNMTWPEVFPWAMAHSQTDFLPLLQIAEL